MRTRVLAGLIACAAAASAAAHHSAALFDTTKQISIEGEVTQFDWRNPHIYMALRVAGADGTMREQKVEAGASSVLLPLGLTPDSVSIGERVTVRGNPSRSGPGNIVLGRELVKADGSVLPLNIGSAASRAAPAGARADSIAGTWFPPLGGFRGFVGGLGSWPLTERGRAAAASYDASAASYADCIPVTAPALMVYPVTSTVEVTADVVRFHVDWMASERVVYLDGRGHPENGAPTLHGHSIGHWDGGTLVVDTAQFAAHKEGIALGMPGSARRHVVERFSLTADRKHLKYDVELEDPEYLSGPIRYSSEWDYRPDLMATGLACDLDVARRFLREE